MKTRQGYAQGRNVQAAVSQGQTIVAVGVTQEANDGQQLAPMLDALEGGLEEAGIEERPWGLLGDAGSWSEANVTTCTRPLGPELLIAATPEPCEGTGSNGSCSGRRGAPEGARHKD